ncbi:MAG TPA: sugar ABC transporter substrate-binding protein [Steroidobacteraceae bacterium]|nr:sugar ABC transporter substrate-binding protein [Steroidobacteraceae bacterium]
MAGLRPALAQANAALAFALALLPGGCARSPAQPEVLHFWAVGIEAEALADVLPEFERTHPDVRIEVQQLAWTGAHEKLLTAVAGDATPDLCQLGNTWIPELVALNALEPLQARVSGSVLIAPGDYFSGIWQSNVLDGVLYGVPWYIDTRLMFYRSDLLRAAGFDAPATTWPEWLEQMQAIKRLGGPDRYAVLLPLNQFEPLQVLALEQPEPMLRDGNRYGNFRSASFRRALAFYHSLFRQGLAPALTETQVSNVWNEFGRGYFAFYVSGPWNIEQFRRRLPPGQQQSWMTAPMPGPDGPGVSSAGGSSLVIFNRSRHKASAFALIEYLSQPAVQRRFHQLTGDLPPRRSTWQAGAIAADAYSRAFRVQLERLRAVPQVPEWEQIMQAMRTMGERVVRGEQAEDEATAQLDAEVDEMLAKRRWMLARQAAT